MTEPNKPAENIAYSIELEAQAKNGDAEAQFQMGRVLSKGVNIEKDSEAANVWYQKAATQGHYKAQFNYGYNLIYGIGTDADFKTGVDLLEQSYKNGALKAAETLGRLHYLGLGRPIDQKKAVDLWTEAANKGDDLSQYRLGEHYFQKALDPSCTNNEDSEMSAYKFFMRAAAQGNSDALFGQGLCYKRGCGVNESLSDAVTCFQTASDRGQLKAKFYMATAYKQGGLVPADTEKACVLYTEILSEIDAQVTHIVKFFMKNKAIKGGSPVLEFQKIPDNAKPSVLLKILEISEIYDVTQKSKDNLEKLGRLNQSQWSSMVWFLPSIHAMASDNKPNKQEPSQDIPSP
jgi:TPR repeat protein